jgi:cyclopropane fatty-acyl-phospholipid synthase-like methyltransferase
MSLHNSKEKMGDSSDLREEFDREYYEEGEDTGKSCYTNYRWMPERTLATAAEIIRRANIQRKDRILDYGCAKGFMVKAFEWLGYNAYGYDFSKYAIENCDSDVKEKVFNEIPPALRERGFETVLCKDTAEHVPYDSLDDFLSDIRNLNNRNAIFIIPLGDGKKFNIPRFERDVTHQIREPVGWWASKIEQSGYLLENITNDVPGIKPGWNVPGGNIYIEGVAI